MTDKHYYIKLAVSQNSKMVRALFQLNHISKYFQIMKIQLHQVLLVALAQYFSKSSSSSTVCRKPVWLTKVFSVVFLVTIFMDYWFDWTKLIYTEIPLCFFGTNSLFFNMFTESVSKQSRTMLWLSSEIPIM